MKEICGTCRYNRQVFIGHGNSEFCCENEDSDYYGVPTLMDDSCEDWEGKDAE